MWSNDVDPISLERLDDVECVWAYEFDNKVFGYDAWTWLEYACHTRDIRHPVFRVGVTPAQLRALYVCCRDGTPAPSPHQRALLTQCETTHITSTKTYHPNKDLESVLLVPDSPLYRVHITDHQSVAEHNLATFVKCRAVVDVDLVNWDDCVVAHFKRYIG
jgi:hypothetical protein